MIRIKQDNKYFYLSIINYQYPDIDDKDYDGNWLMINIKVNNGEYEWECKDLSLLTWEVQKISKWFLDLSMDNTPDEWNLNFIEPNLRFEYIDSDYKSIYFIIYFSIELLPPGYNKSEECFIKFSLSRSECKNISNMFKQELNKYPIRE